MGKKTIKRSACMFGILCVFMVLLGYIPSFTVGYGYLFGIYKVDMWDDILHITSALLAATVAFYSTNATILFFKTIGTLYLLDGIFGFFFEHGFLDLSIFLHKTAAFGPGLRLAANTPHLLIGLFALYVGFVLGRKYVPSTYLAGEKINVP